MSAGVGWKDFVLQLIVAPVVAGLIVGGLVTLVSLAVSPGWFAGWRLQKLLDLANGLDNQGRITQQREVLHEEIHRRVTTIAVRAKVPTDWPMIVARNVIVGAAVGSNTALLIIATYYPTVLPLPAVPSWQFWVACVLAAITPVVLNVIGGYALTWGNRASRFTTFYRRKFEQDGLPSGFTLPDRPRPRWWNGQDPPEPWPPWWRASAR